MPGDGMGVRDIGQVSGGTCCKRQSTSSDDGSGARSECDAGVECGRRQCESDAGIESRRDRISINDGARGEHGHCKVHGASSVWQDRMRVDRVGVGDVSEVPAGAWSREHSSICDDGRPAGRKCI